MEYPLCERCGKVKLIQKKRRLHGYCAKCSKEKNKEVENLQEQILDYIQIPPEPYTRKFIGVPQKNE